MKLYQSILLFVLMYIILLIRHQLFVMPNDSTIYIEDQYVSKIRDDNKITIYEKPPTVKNKGSILSEVRLHRCFYSRIFHLSAPENMQIQIYIFSPEQTQYLYPNTHLIRLNQTSPINVTNPQLESYPLFKKAESIEIPIIGMQSFVIPRGWWIFVDSPSHIFTKTF